MRNRRQAVFRRVVCLAGAIALLARCAGAEGPPRSTVSHEVTFTVGAQEVEVDFSFCANGENPEEPGDPCGLDGAISLRVVNCSAKLSCEDAFLHDPVTFVRSPTLITGFSCGFPPGTPQDALLSFHPAFRCYTGGVIGERETWTPTGGIEVIPQDGEHRFFSQEAATQGDVYTNLALLMRPLRAGNVGGVPTDFAFCELSAWGAIAFANFDDGARRAEHVARSPAVEWRALVEWTASGWDCHTDDEALTSVERVVLAAAIHDKPAPDVRLALPASHGVVLLREELVTTGAETVDGAMLRFTDDSVFPLAPADEPEPMIERALCVDMPSLPEDPTNPADIRIDKTCVELDDGAVSAIGILVSERLSHVGLGAIVLLPGAGGWDCERVASGACERLEKPQWSLVVPCLQPGSP